jgi:hypothetical protein
VDTLGPLACDLACQAGLIADGWQQDGADVLLSIREDGKWACFEYGEIVPRQNGKGGLLEIRVLAGFLLLGERLIMWSSHEYKTSMESFRRVKTLIVHLGKRVSENLIDVDGILIKVVNTNGEEGFERLDTGARIRFLARSKGSGRGFTGDLNIIDEAFAYTFLQHEALLPTVSAVANPQFIYTSTPPLEGESGEVMYALKERAEAGGDPSLGWRDWGIDGDLDHLDRIDLDDRELWAQANPAYGIRISEETVRRERASMSDEGFARERLGIWPAVSMDRKSIDPAVWARLADPDSRRTGAVAIACDVSQLRDWAAIAVYGERADGLGHVQLLDYRAGTDWLVPRLKELKKVLAPVAIGMGRGTAASLAVELKDAGLAIPEDAENPKAGDLAVTNATDMAAATAGMFDAIQRESFRQVPGRQLDLAVKGAKTQQRGDVIAWSRRDTEADISPLVAMTLARWAFATRSQALKNNDYDLLNSVW